MDTNKVGSCVSMLVMVWKWIQQLPTKDNNMQQGVPMHPTCNIQQCWELLANNVYRPFAWGFMVQFYRWFKLYFSFVSNP